MCSNRQKCIVCVLVSLFVAVSLICTYVALTKTKFNQFSGTSMVLHHDDDYVPSNDHAKHNAEPQPEETKLHFSYLTRNETKVTPVRILVTAPVPSDKTLQSLANSALSFNIPGKPVSETKIRNKRFIDDNEENNDEFNLEDESRMYAMQIKVPELPNVDVARILELYKPSNGYNSYEKSALKELIEFVRTKNFQYILTKMDTNTLFASFQITRGQFIKKLMSFIRNIENLDRDVSKATDIIENCIDNNFDSDMVDVDVIDEIDEIEETAGRLDIRETLAGVLGNATEEVIKAAINLRKFFRNPDLRFGLLFRGLNYALNELNNEEKIIVILLRLKKDFKTTLRQRENNSINLILKYLNYKPENYNNNIKPIDIFKNIEKDIPDDVKLDYEHIKNIQAVEELDELHSFPDIADIFKLGFSNETNLAILLRTITVQSLMSIPPDRATAHASEMLYKFTLLSRPMSFAYESPKIIVNEIKNLLHNNTTIPSLIVTSFNKVISVLEKYGPLFSSEFSHLLTSNTGNELISRALTMFRMKLPQKELKVWTAFEKIFQYLNIKQDYEINLPSDYNFADEFSIACRLGNIQEQYRINTISQLILLKNQMPSIFNGMRTLRQYPIRIRVIILLNRIDLLNLPQLSDQFKFQLRGIISELTGDDDDIKEIIDINSDHLEMLFKYAVDSVENDKYKNRFKEIKQFIDENPYIIRSTIRESILMFDYSPRRQLSLLLRKLFENRLGLNIPERISKLLKKCLNKFSDNNNIGDEQFIGIKSTIELLMDHVFSGNENLKVTQPIIEARETLKKLYNSNRIDFRYLLRDVRLYKYIDRTQFLIILYRTAAIKELFTNDELYREYGHAVRTLIHFFGINLNDIKSESVDLPEEIEDLLEQALPNDVITKSILRARNVLIKALETGVIDRRIAYDGIQCYARNASPKKKIEYIIRNIWPIRIDIPSDVSRAIHDIKDFSEISVDEDTELPINIYSFDFQEVFDEVITPNEPQQMLKAKEILYRDFEVNTGRYRIVLNDFERGKKYPIQDIAKMISESIISKVDLKRQSDQKILNAANDIYKYLSSADLQLDRFSSVEQLLTGNAQNYVA